MNFHIQLLHQWYMNHQVLDNLFFFQNTFLQLNMIQKEQENFKVILKVTPSGIAGFLSGYKEEYFEANGKIVTHAKSHNGLD